MGTAKYNNQKNVSGSIIKKLREQECMEIKDLCREYQLRGISIDRYKLYKIENNKISIKDFELIATFEILDADMNILKEYLE